LGARRRRGEYRQRERGGEKQEGERKLISSNQWLFNKES
jgi:hypothetical protein